MLFFRVLLTGMVLWSVQTNAQLPEPCLRLVGQVVDYATRQPIPQAQLMIQLPTTRTLGGKASATGSFSFTVSCAATAIVIEKAGYRPQSLTLRQQTVTAGISRIAVLIPLIPADGQAHDRPYLQTEQTEYVQQISLSRPGSGTMTNVQHGTFVITDAVRGVPLLARACFFSTQTGQKKCVDANAQGTFTIDFNQVDIIAMEVDAPGYQTYAGNLRIEQVDGRFLRHEVRLVRGLTLLTVQAAENARCELRTKNQTIALNPIPGQPGWFNAYNLLPQSYTLVVTTQGQTRQQAIMLNNGLNYKIIAPSAGAVREKSAPQTPAIEAISIASRIVPDSLPPIYFEQSSYTLRSDSRDVLIQVAEYLNTHSDAQLHIKGFTDNVGVEQLNQSLSEYRASVTANFLNRQGVAAHRLVTAGYGSRNPIVPNDTEENKARNRRVSLQIMKTQ